MACNGIQVQPGCCECRAAYGGDDPVSGLIQCYSNLAGDILLDPALLAGRGLAFIGPRQASAGVAYSYPAPAQTAIKAWVEAGGRLFFTANPLDTFDTVPTNSTNYNNFLGFLGTGLQLTTNIPAGCPPTLDCFDCVPSPIGIMNGLAASFRYAYAGEISGGTPLASTQIMVGSMIGCDVNRVFMAAEQVGSGLVVACASSVPLISDSCGINCEFYNRLCSWAVSRIMDVP